MSSSRKLLSLVVAFALVFSLMAPALAATPADVVGTPYEDSVGKLNALGILEGYPDGTFKPDQNITRAEFAKIACYVIGVQAAADLSKGSTRFKDVKATHWASGVINIASEKGLIKGYPDGTFKPEANVSYAEAITILVRALGLGPVVEGKGTWPANYLSKASETGITDDVSGLVGNEKAIRGTIAQLSMNALTAEKWGEKEYTADGVVYGPLGKSLMEEKYKDFVYKDANNKYVPKSFEDVEVTGTQYVGGLGEGQVQLKLSEIATKLSITALTDVPRQISANEIVVEVADGIDTRDLVGKKVDVFLGKDNVVVTLKVKSSMAKEGHMSVKEITLPNGTHNGKIELLDGTKYSLSANAKAYVNFKDYTGGDNAATLNAIAADVGSRVMKVSAVLNSDGLVSTLNISVADKFNITDPSTVTNNAKFNANQFIVKAIESDADVTALHSGNVIFNLDDLTDKDKTTGNKTTFVKNGSIADSEDLKVGDVVTYIKVSDTVHYVLITDNKITGSVSSILVDSDAVNGDDRYKVVMGGNTFTMTADGMARMTKTGDINDKTAVDSTFIDFLGKEVTLSLNSIGQIVMINGTVTASSASGEYGILTKAIWEGTTPDANGKLPKYMEVRTAAGEKRALVIKGDKYKTAAATIPSSAATEWNIVAGSDTNMVAGTLVRYSVDADGMVNAVNLVKMPATAVTDAANKVYSAPLAAAPLANFNNSAETIAIGGTTYYYNSDTVIFNKHAGVFERIDGWSTLITGDTDGTNAINGTDIYVIYDNDTKLIKHLIIDIADTEYLSSDSKFGIVTGLTFADNSSGETEWKIKIYREGSETTYSLEDLSKNVYDNTVAGWVYTVNIGDLVRFTVNGSGEFVGGADDAERLANFLVDKSRVADNLNNAYSDCTIKSVNASDRMVYFVDGDSTRAVKVTSDVKIYDVSGDTPAMLGLSDLQAGMTVIEVEHADATENGMYKMLVVVKR